MIAQTMLRGAVAVAVIALAACGQGGETPAGTTSEQIAIDGSSTVFPLAEAAAEAFTNSQTAAARVTVGESGTGGGFGKFCRGETQISNASRPISSGEMAACAAANIQYIEIPIAFDGISVVVHPSNPLTNITMAELSRAWAPAAERTITQWRQVNPQAPNIALQLFGPGTASGTFDYFNEAVNGDGGASRTDYTPSEDDNVVVQGVSGNPGAMGYFGYAYYEQNQRAPERALDQWRCAVAGNDRCRLLSAVAAGVHLCERRSAAPPAGRSRCPAAPRHRDAQRGRRRRPVRASARSPWLPPGPSPGC